MSDVTGGGMLFIVGAQKSGTTTLADVLNQHPEFFVYPGKEPNFFGEDLTRYVVNISAEEYSHNVNKSAGRIAIDASTVYLISKSAPQEIKNYDNEAKIVIMLRDPINMLHSWHAQMLFTGNESEDDFYEAIKLEEERRKDKKLPLGVIVKERLFYSDVGKYYDKVKRYIDVFGEKNVKVIFFEDFVKDVPEHSKAVAEYAGAGGEFVFSSLHSNPNTVVRSAWLRDIRRMYIKSKSARVLMKNKFPGVMSFIGNVYNLINTKKKSRDVISREAVDYLRSDLIEDALRLEKLLGVSLKEKWKTLFDN